MSEGDPELLAAIYAAPDRDEPRLVYADALLDRGELLGELIQLQVAQAKLRPRSAGFHQLQRRIDAIWAEGWARWTPKVPSLETGAFCEWRFTRGFPTAVHTTPPLFVEAMPEFFAAAPLLDEVELDCARSGPLGLDSVRWLERMFKTMRTSGFGLDALRLQSVNDAGAVVLSGQDGVRALKGLELSRTNLGTATYLLMGASSSAFRDLTRIELLMANARDAALEHLFRHPWDRLTALLVGNEVVGERGLRAITRPGVLSALRALDLSWSVLGGVKAIDVLAQCGTLPWLSDLDLSHCEVSDSMAIALAGTKGCALKSLRLAHSGVGAAGVRALIGAPVCEGLELLDLTGVAVDGATRTALNDRFGDRVLLPVDDPTA